MDAASDRAENPELSDEDSASAAVEMERLVQVYLTLPAAERSDPALQASLERLCDASLQLQLDAFAAPVTPEAEAGSPKDDLPDVTTFLSAEDLKKTYEEVDRALKETSLGFEVKANDVVIKYVVLYQTKLRGWFSQALVRGTPYVPQMQAIFKDEGIPPSLVYMAIVESAFNPNAVSRAKAVGMWQFIQGTAKRYGLEVDFWEDQRRDPVIAARAAARYLKDLNGMFGDWELALAAYNCGEGKILRYTKQSDKDDFWHLRTTRHIRRETREYVPAIMAAVLLASNPKAYGFEVPGYAPPEPAATVSIPEPTDLRVLARCAQSPVETLQAMNPSLKRLMTPPRKFDLRIPAKNLEGFQARLDATPAQERLAVTMHTVSRGESLKKISQSYGVPAEAIRLANRLPGRKVKAGQTLVIPLGTAATDPSLYAEERPSSRKGSRVYKVRRGDTLSSVSRKTGVPVETLKELNGLESDALLAGQRLVLGRAAKPAAATKASPRAPKAEDAERKERVHHVRAGDTLWDLSRKYGTTVDRICRANRISPRTKLRVGDTLVIP
jgi:membrane-bound lytic murein transglycosylase D